MPEITLRRGRFLVLFMFVLTFTGISYSADPLECGANGPEVLKPYGNIKDNFMRDLVVKGQCDVNADPSQQGPLVYAFHNVNIVKNGQLIFHDDYDIDFYAESILVENGGKLVAISTKAGFLPSVSRQKDAAPFQKRLTFHLWGKEDEAGIECQSATDSNTGPCGVPKTVWESNPTMADHLMMDPPPPPSLPKNQACKSIKGYSQFLPEDDCFYQYEIQDAQDRTAGRKAYFGHKVLAVSFGGTLQLFGSLGVSYLKQGEKCMAKKAGTECNPAFSGTSWVRLTGVTDATNITVNRPVDWKEGNHIVVTGTDYLPSHSQEVVLAEDASGTKIKLKSPGIETSDYNHRATTYKFGEKGVPADVGPVNDPNLPELNREIDTRAAVALLNRNIQIVSEGNTPSEPFTEKPHNYYGGHTMVRQGFLSYQVQGVEFYQLGQGGRKGRYPVHFHMLRKVAQPEVTDQDPTPEPLNYLKDCSIWDSMTRWVTLHATEGMYIGRNVGYKSIGHGYYLEDATEVNNKLYSNIGILARAAIMDITHNPRQVPGILADNSPVGGPKNMDYMPYRSDYNHPSVFWITNGWNDFEYNFAAGAATCGACYWWIGTGVSGPSQYETWDGYASQQITRDKQSSNWERAGITPLDKFIGNSCVAAMNSFQMNGQTGECLGMTPAGSSGLAAVQSTAPPGPTDYLAGQPFQIYYPVITDLHNPTICVPDEGTNDCSAGLAGRAPCDGGDYYSTCTVTKLDHYTTSFNYAQTNFAAVWLRKGWDLFSNGAVTDVQTSGLNFITGGGYTRSDVNLGEWLLARNTVLVGHTQDSSNPFASPLGPFNVDSGLSCDNTSAQARNYCAYAAGGVTFNLPILPGQKLLNIYDGPSHQENNAFLDINVSTVDNCSGKSGGTCFGSKDPLAWNFGVLQDKQTASCYIPNAAIGWKQPNGFYYPPAFHSKNLFFKNVDIRHFVVDPLFKYISPEDYDPFQQDQSAVEMRYCTWTPDMFSKDFNHIDRQTVLNDDDGTLTGLIGTENGVGRPSLSINEDPFFNTPLTTPECLSDINVKPPLPIAPGLPYTATTSPYEWLSTAVIADCGITGKQCVDPADADSTKLWATDCGNSSCRGVPLYREYLTVDEFTKGKRPQIRMMGQAKSQRSTLSLNHARYYIDTTQTCESQGGCPKCAERDINTGACVRWEGAPSPNPSIFLKGHTYYVYFIYATDKTQQKYDLYVPKSTLDKADVRGIQIDPTNGYQVKDVGSFVTAEYNDPILTVSVDLSSQKSAFSNSKASFCRPKSYCKTDGDACVCKDKTKCQDSDCAWGPSDIDCPADPNNPNLQQCFGFRFTMPADYVAPDKPVPPPSQLFVTYKDQKDTSYFNNTDFKRGSGTDASDKCQYPALPQKSW